jgi:hypothetical protein
MTGESGWVPGAITDDQLWAQALRVDKRLMTLDEGEMTDVMTKERRLHMLIRLGIVDESSTDKHWESSVRAMRHTSVIADQLYTMLREERTKVIAPFFVVEERD